MTKMNNRELMEKIVEVRTAIWNKRHSTDGSVELLEEYLSVLEEDAKQRIKVLKEDIDYMEMMLWEVTGIYKGDTDGDEKESPKSKYIITLL